LRDLEPWSVVSTGVISSKSGMSSGIGVFCLANAKRLGVAANAVY